MPWRESVVMDEKLRFIARLLDGERMAELCREFGISRKTGYKIWDRYRSCGIQGLPSQSRKPYKNANRLPLQVESLIVGVKKEKPTWGARKISERLKRKYPELQLPSKSTIHAVLDRNGLVNRQRKRRYKAEGTVLSSVDNPNALWCADYKGEFLLGNRKYCYPLTITDYCSRFLISCEALETTKEPFAFAVFE